MVTWDRNNSRRPPFAQAPKSPAGGLDPVVGPCDTPALRQAWLSLERSDDFEDWG